VITANMNSFQPTLGHEAAVVRLTEACVEISEAAAEGGAKVAGAADSDLM
jgi:hypothetical protein